MDGPEAMCALWLQAGAFMVQVRELQVNAAHFL